MGWNQRHYTARAAGCTEPGLMAVTAANTYPGLKPLQSQDWRQYTGRVEAVQGRDWRQHTTWTGGSAEPGLKVQYTAKAGGRTQQGLQAIYGRDCSQYIVRTASNT